MDISRNNPYVGPRTFEEDDAAFFYGRERESRDLLAFVISEPLVLFYAQSGAGKSSLINTSLIPGLRDESFTMFPVARVGGDLPEGITDVRNIYTFNLLANLEKEADPTQFVDTILTDYLAQGTDGDASQPRVLIIDQFEEIVTNHPGRWQDREDFFWQLQAAIQNDPLLWVVLTMREDHIAALDPYAEILPGGLRARFHMQRLKAVAAETAVMQPATKAGKPFDKGVAKTLVKNLSQIRDTSGETSSYRYGEYVEPVQLQVVCFQLWENLRQHNSAVITEQHVRELGNVDRALADFYNQAVVSVVKETAVSEIELRKWFDTQLITEAHTRGTVYQGAETTAGMPNELVHELANRFLLRADQRAGGMWYEIVHDRFVSPILQANQAWRDQQSLVTQAAIAWDESNRDSSKLYLGEQLKDTLDTVDRRNLGPLAITFLRACGRENQLIAEKEEQRKRDLKQAQEFAEAEQERAESEAKSAKRLRSLASVLGIMSIVVVILLFVANSLRVQANENTETAVTSEYRAKESAYRASTAEYEANENAYMANESALMAATSEAIAIAAQLTSQAQLNTIYKQNESIASTATILAATAIVEQEEVILDVPYLSMDDPTASSHVYDGGPTALAMVLNSNPNRTRDVTTDMLYDSYSTPVAREEFTDFPNLINAAQVEQSILFQKNYHTPSNALAELKAMLRDGKPAIVFIDHRNLEGSSYPGQNYLVVVGFDYNNVYVHDPANPAPLNCYRKLSNGSFMGIWGAASGSDNEEYNFMTFDPENMLPVGKLEEIPQNCR